eukprot:4836204-Prorocentrum_lima.AAC.1
MTSSLVGSEMCIRDRSIPSEQRVALDVFGMRQYLETDDSLWTSTTTRICLLYTSDAADDM